MGKGHRLIIADAAPRSRRGITGKRDRGHYGRGEVTYSSWTATPTTPVGAFYDDFHREEFIRKHHIDAFNSP